MNDNVGIAMMIAVLMGGGALFGHFFWPHTVTEAVQVPVLADGAVKDCLDKKGGSFEAYYAYGRALKDIKTVCTVTEQKSVQEIQVY